MKRLIIAAVTLCLIAGTVAAQRPPRAKRSPVLGVNLPWIENSYGSDFGHSESHPEWGVRFDANLLDTYFADMKDMGLSVVRIFVFEDLEGLDFDAEGYVSGVEEMLLDNYSQAGDLAAKHGLSLYLCLAQNVYNICKRDGKKDFIINVRAREAYYQNAVVPLVKRLKGKPIAAFDIINEPEYEGEGKAGYPWTTIRNFIDEGVAAIHKADRTRKVSVGGLAIPLDAEQCARYRGLSVDFYDFHVYRTDGYLPPAWSLGLDKPIIIGECGVRIEDCNDDQKLKRGLENFLRNARQGGYSGILYWCYGYGGSKEPRMQLLRGHGSSEWRPAAHCFKNLKR